MTRAGPRWAGAPAIDRIARRVLRTGKIPGLSLGLVRGGKRLYAEGHGVRDRELGLPASAETVYGVASVTKSFTALAILRLEEHGRLRVQDPVVRHLPEFRTPEPARTRRITLHHFLTHTSGLPPLPSIYYAAARGFVHDPPYDPRVARRVGISPDHPPIDSYDGMLDFLATEPYRLLGPPGGQFSYSNEAFGLLGAVVERASGRSYESFVEEEILRPAAMHRTTFDSGIMYRFPEVTALYSPDPDSPPHRLRRYDQWWEDTCLRACGGLRTNVDDLLRYVELYLRGGRVGKERIIGAATLGRMLRPAIEISPGLFYGYGVAVRPDYFGRRLAFHDGGLRGVSSQFAVVPDRGLGGVVLANAEQVPANRALERSFAAVLGLPPNAPFVPAPPPGKKPTRLTEFGGHFCSGEGIWMRVTPRATTLRVDFVGIEAMQRGIVVVPTGPDRFERRAPRTRGYLRFQRDRKGRVDRAFQGWRILRRRSARERATARRGGIVW